jgi:hypothetical protein
MFDLKFHGYVFEALKMALVKETPFFTRKTFFINVLSDFVSDDYAIKESKNQSNRLIRLFRTSSEREGDARRRSRSSRTSSTRRRRRHCVTPASVTAAATPTRTTSARPTTRAPGGRTDSRAAAATAHGKTTFRPVDKAPGLSMESTR